MTKICAKIYQIDDEIKQGINIFFQHIGYLSSRMGILYINVLWMLYS
jgi:hypothetical protein